MEILSARLQLRPYQPQDWEAVLAFRGDAEALKYEPWGPETASQVRQELNDAQLAAEKRRAGDLHWAICLREGALIGGCRMLITAKAGGPNAWATVGYVIQRSFWGQGYATETMQALIAQARTVPQIVGIKAISDSENHASVRVLEKCGLSCVGMIAEIEQVKGRFRDMLQYELKF